MNARITRLGVFLMCCYVLLFVQLNRVQVLDRDELTGHPANNRSIVRDFDRPRGSIVSADGVLLAESVEMPAPVSTTTRTVRSPSICAQIACSSASVAASTAFITAGRSMVTRATWPSSS